MAQLQLAPAVIQYLMCFFVRLVYLVMGFVEVRVVMIKGKAAGKYIAMSANGELYTTASKNCLLLKSLSNYFEPLSQSECWCPSFYMKLRFLVHL